MDISWSSFLVGIWVENPFCIFNQCLLVQLDPLGLHHVIIFSKTSLQVSYHYIPLERNITVLYMYDYICSTQVLRLSFFCLLCRKSDSILFISFLIFFFFTYPSRHRIQFKSTYHIVLFFLANVFYNLCKV